MCLIATALTLKWGNCSIVRVHNCLITVRNDVKLLNNGLGICMWRQPQPQRVRWFFRPLNFNYTYAKSTTLNLVMSRMLRSAGKAESISLSQVTTKKVKRKAKSQEDEGRELDRDDSNDQVCLLNHFARLQFTEPPLEWISWWWCTYCQKAV